MAEFVMRYADSRGHVKEQRLEGPSANELRDRMTQQGYLVYSVRPAGMQLGFGRKKVDVEKFLIFNQQFVTLIRAGLPILKSLDLLADRLTDKRMGPYVRNVRDEVKTGSLLSDSFGRQSIFPPIYVTTVMAGEKSGALAEVLDRFITYQRLTLSVRKKILLSLVYPALLVVLTLCLVAFLITYVVPSFADLYSSMETQLPTVTQVLIQTGTTVKEYVLVLLAGLAGLVVAFQLWSRTESAKLLIENVILRVPLLGDIWIKFQVAQFSRVMGTLLLGGIPLLQALETAGNSLNARILLTSIQKIQRMVREGQSLSHSMKQAGVFPQLSIDMAEVGESTGALPTMLNSTAEFFEEEVTAQTTAALSLIEPLIMIFLGVFVAFVLVALYLPIFSIADKIR
jgi:type IV pilus assembly protein PilC